MTWKRVIRAVALMGLGMMGGACSNGWCWRDVNCSHGMVCIHYRGEDTWDSCEVPCTDESQCSAGQSCTCPDSPQGKRCQTDQGTGTRFCM